MGDVLLLRYLDPVGFCKVRAGRIARACMEDNDVVRVSHSGEEGGHGLDVARSIREVKWCPHADC
jgi:hypothetical protein